ncbi:MAG: type IV pilus twitching motility protein PilT [Planctomycetota bacterium]
MSESPIQESQSIPDDSAADVESQSKKVDKYFRAMSKHAASDMHMKADTPCKFRMKGAIRNIDQNVLTHEKIEAMMFELLTDKQMERYKAHGSLDFAYQLGDADRFRINIFQQRGKMSVAARRVPREILSYKQLHLPESIIRLTELHQGLVLFAGITGSGKSTSIAALLEEINSHRACHIVTVEDPIEFLYDDKKAFINQREIGLDVDNFSDALKYLMRQDPDVILIGELRDEETFGAAISAAETGHLVFGTIHASSAAATIGRILELFPEEARPMIRTSMAFNLQAVVCLKLVPGIRPDVPRIPTCEIMITNSTIRKMIAEERDSEIGAVIRNSYHEGMIDFTESLRLLVEEEFISVQAAYAAAPNPDELKMRLKGISVNSGGIIG